MEKKRYNISVFTENTIGILNRLTIIFTRRHINIDSITASETELKDVYRYTIVLHETELQVRKVVAQLEKQVDVLKAFYHCDTEIVYQELALMKVRLDEDRMTELEQIIRRHNARLLAVSPEYAVFELTGHEESINLIVDDLETFDLLEFARSGRVAVTKPMKTLEAFINELA
ncbi:MAG TPA: acetolactate synthase small subunit [Fluviicola sp.]|nr:acetolactate synthase small subunit [Fluviicola sp.]